MISTFKLKFGRAPNVAAETVHATAVTVFVGPNNSGKSKVLSEIAQYCSTGQKQASQVVLEEAEFSGLTEEQALTAIDHIRQPPNLNEALQVNHIIVGGRSGRIQVQLDSIKNAVIEPSSNVPGFCQWFLKFATLILDGKSRINLVNQQSAGDLQSAPQSSFQLLFRDDEKRKEVRRIVFDAFGLHFVIDPTNLGNLRIRLSKNAPASDVQERGIHDAAVQFHKEAQLIDEASDGVKAFTGIVTEVMAGDPKVILVDEPEAFLHPSLAALLVTKCRERP